MNTELKLAELMRADAPKWRERRQKLENTGVLARQRHGMDNVLSGGDEHRVTERWEDRKKRVAAEKAAAKKALQIRPNWQPHDVTVAGVVSRAEAKKAGLRRYYTGNRCKFGHLAERLVTNAVCVVCHRRDVKESTRRAKIKYAGEAQRSGQVCLARQTDRPSATF